MLNRKSGNYEIAAYNETAISILENALKFNDLDYSKYGSHVIDISTGERKHGTLFIIKPRNRKDKKLIENISGAMSDLFINGVAL